MLVTLLADAESWLTMARPVWLALGAAVLAGTALGGWVKASLPAAWARAGVLVVSMAGGVITMADGLLSGGA